MSFLRGRRAASLLMMTMMTTLATTTTAARGEDGYRLWLRYEPVSSAARRDEYRAALRELVIDGRSPALDAAARELLAALPTMLDQPLARADAPTADGALVVSSRADSP